MSDPIESEEIEGVAASTGEVLEDGEALEDGGGAEETTAPRRDEPTSTLAIVLALEQAELRVTKLSAIAEEKAGVLASINSSIGETQAILGRLDALDNLALEDVHVLENTKRKLRRLESERVAAGANLSAAGADLAEATKELDAAELAESEDRLKRLSDSVGATVLLFASHVRALVTEVLGFATEVQSAAPHGHTFKTPPAFPFRSVLSANLPALPGEGYPRSPAREALELLSWLAKEPLRLASDNAALEARWAAASPILPREENSDGQPN